MLRISFSVLILGAAFSAIAYLFWRNELIYRLPTPVPANYAPVAFGEPVNLDGKLNVVAGKPVFIHFFSPDCPCSRFNLSHFKTLVRDYRDKIMFTVVVLDKKKQYTEEEIQDRYDLDLPISFDESVAATCGVYSTPQAVLLDADHNLYYRGNYNKTRYCTEKSSNYAQIALDSLLANQSKPVFNQYALKAYGCELPNCVK